MDHLPSGEPVTANDPFWYIRPEHVQHHDVVLHPQDVHPDDLRHAVLSLIRVNPAFFVHRFVILQDEAAQLQPFNRWNAGQRRIYEQCIAPDFYAGESVETLVLKPRRIGSSALFSALDYWVTGCHAHTSGVLLAHKEEIAVTLFLVAKRIHNNLPEWLRPETQASSRRELLFNNKEGTGLDSRFYIRTAGATEMTAAAMGRGDTLRLGHFSELDWYAYPEELMIGYRPSLKRQEGTFIFLESTGNGMGGYMDTLWQRCEAGESRIRHTFLAWMDVPWRATADGGWARKYSAKLPCSTKEYANTLTSEEADIIVEHNLTLEQVEWWRQALEECENKRSKRDQEYPRRPELAFISSGGQVFDFGMLQIYDDVARATSPLRQGRLIDDGDDILFSTNKEGALRVYKDFAPGKTYVVGGDAGAGYADGDFTHLAVLCREDLEFVAHFHARWPIDEAAHQMALLGWWYNGALLVPEAPGIGLALVTALRTVEHYPHIYLRRDLRSRVQGQQDRYGYDTNGTTRPLLIADLRTAIDGGNVVIYDREVLRQAHRFSTIDGKEQAPLGDHDDGLFGCALALRGHAEYAVQDPARDKALQDAKLQREAARVVTRALTNRARGNRLA